MKMNIKVISFDIFQTLADVNKRIPQIWKGILGDAYTHEKGRYGAGLIVAELPNILKQAACSGGFRTMQEVYYDCIMSVMNKMGFDVSADSILYHLLYQHSKAAVYEDVLPCMRRLHNRYKIILSSDSNHFMVDDLVDQFIYDELFISDDLRSYKADEEGRFFTQVVDKLKVKPDEIIHIGDSFSDIFGAAKTGIHSCLLNRNSVPWEHKITPEYTITSLTELESILSK